MKGIQLAVQQAVANILPPTAAVAATVSDYFTMENAAHVDVVVTTGSVTNASTLTVREHASDGGTAAAIAFDYYSTATAGSDTFSARTSATAGGISTGTTNNLTFVLSVDAAELTDGSDWLSVAFATAGTIQIAATAILSGLRYASETPVSSLS
jgi:hypothetical protein